MPAKVVDASVLAAIAFAEPRADEAVVLLAGDFLFAPELLPFELCSVAWKKTRRYPEQRSMFEKALDLGIADRCDAGAGSNRRNPVARARDELGRL